MEEKGENKKDKGIIRTKENKDKGKWKKKGNRSEKRYRMLQEERKEQKEGLVGRREGGRERRRE